MQWKKKLIFLAALVPIITFVFGWIAGSNQNPSSVDKVETNVGSSVSNKPQELNLDLFWNIYNLVNQKYLFRKRIDFNSMLYATIKGMISSLDDRYSQFMTPDEYKDFKDSLNGSLEGIGAELVKDKEKLIVVSPLIGSPAELAGIGPGDEILAIDGQSTFAMDLLDAVKKIRGQRGTTVKLTIKHRNTDDTQELTIKRESIKIPSVVYKMLPDTKVVVFQITQFGENTYSEFNKLLSEAQLSSPTMIVLDLRNNGGGLLDEAIKIISEFSDNRVATKIETRISDNSDETKVLEEKTISGGKALGVPVVVWVNKGSASASEIVAAFFRDTGRGYVIGENSFGKGTVQELIPLQNGSSLRVTTARWLTPSGNSIDGVGVEPDFVIDDLYDMTPEKREELYTKATLDYLSTIDKN